MKILFYNHTAQVNDAASSLLMTLSRLDRHRFMSVLVCPSDGPLKRMAADMDVEVQSIDSLKPTLKGADNHLFRYPSRFVSVTRELRQIVNTTEPDLIHANSLKAGLLALVATRGLNTQIVWHLHRRLPRNPSGSLLRLIARSSNRILIIAASQSIAESAAGAWADLKSRTTVLLTSVELGSFRPSESARKLVRDDLKLGSSYPVLGIIGELNSNNGQLDVLPAYAKALSEFPRAMLLLAGSASVENDAQYEATVKASIERLGIGDRVRLTAGRKDVSALLQSLDLLIVNSKSQSLRTVALQAMACGTPMLVASSVEADEMFQHGRTGWLVKRGDKQALANAIVELGRNPSIRVELAVHGRNHVATRFSATRYISELQAFYTSLGKREPQLIDRRYLGLVRLLTFRFKPKTP